MDKIVVCNSIRLFCPKNIIYLITLQELEMLKQIIVR